MSKHSKIVCDFCRTTELELDAGRDLAQDAAGWLLQVNKRDMCPQCVSIVQRAITADLVDVIAKRALFVGGKS